MLKDDKVFLRHMLDSAKETVDFAKDHKREDLDTDRQLMLAITKDIEIIGEAASKISDETQEKFSSIPWSSIIGMRNRLIHAYFDVDKDRIWDTVQDDLPHLITELEKIISENG
jgi:uncharacterized protein with HEPN domain